MNNLARKYEISCNFEKFIKSYYSNWKNKSKEEQGHILRSAWMKMHEEGIDWSKTIKMDNNQKQVFFNEVEVRSRKSQEDEYGRENKYDNLESCPDIIKEELDDDDPSKDCDERYKRLVDKLPLLEAEAVRLLTEPDLKPVFTLCFEEKGMLMIRRRAYIRLLWDNVKPNAC